MIRKLLAFTLLTTASVLVAAEALAEVSAERAGDNVTVKIDGKAFAEYVADFKGTPIVWPIIGPTEKPMTRAYPMGKGPGEREDHPHHRSLWFTHGDVNGSSFWHRETIRHREYVRVEGGRQAVIVTRNDWLASDGRKQCEDRRTLTFGTDGDARWIDFDITIKAGDSAVEFGDTKEGTFAVRVAGTMKTTATPPGHIVNSEGHTDADAWGKAAAWVDYYGPVDGETVGIAILNHPSSFRYPTYWHVRTYGLFAANPFGLHDFQRGQDVNGSHTLKPGESMTFRYRVLFHRGDHQAAGVAKAFEKYSELEK